MFCPLLDRAYVIVPEYAIALAKELAPNVSAQCGWAVKVMTGEELDADMGQAVTALRQLDGVDLPLAERLVGEGVLWYLDLAGVDPAKMVELIGIPIHQAENLVRQCMRRYSAVSTLFRAASDRRTIGGLG